MPPPSAPQPTAFVIMPFGQALDTIYEHFIQHTVEDNGFIATRADNSANSQAITKDIILLIRNSDLIIADLTDANANVYYELGIAHAFGKPVILLSQDIDEVRFDLQAYRCLLYTDHFHDMDRARLDLAERLQAFTAGTLQFGSPVSDALNEVVTYERRPKEGNDTEKKDDNADDDLGSVDYAIDLEEGTNALAASIERYGERTRDFTGVMTSYSEEIEEKLAEQQPVSNRERRRLFRSFAAKMEDYARYLAEENDSYSTALDKTEVALDGVVNSDDELANEDDYDVQRLAEVLEETELACSEFEEAIGGAASSANAMPRVERNLNRARSETVRQLNTMAENANRTVSVLSRARRTIEARLQNSN